VKIERSRPGTALALARVMKTLIPMVQLCVVVVGLVGLAATSTGCETRERVVVRNPPPPTVRVYAPPPVEEKVIVR
jgi:hypothetical protein